jgi:hypothetical protein
LIEAVAHCHAPSVEAFGAVSSCAKIQLCPQHRYHLDDELADTLMEAFPGTQFRLHASVRVQKPHIIVDASTPASTEVDDYFTLVASLSKRFGSSVYSLHAGERKNCSLDEMAERIQRLQDRMGMVVAVEGLYPNAHRPQLLDSWQEYGWLLNSGLSYALDLSHVQIIAAREKRIETGLLREMLASPRCVEVHLSNNDGFVDSHQPILDTARLWWWNELAHAHVDTDFFTEGNVRSMLTRH